MAAVHWSQFSKAELVELLEHLVDQRCIDPLDTMHDSHFVKVCSCNEEEEMLPSRVLEIRDSAANRVKSTSPLAQVLRTASSRLSRLRRAR